MIDSYHGVVDFREKLWPLLEKFWINMKLLVLRPIASIRHYLIVRKFFRTLVCKT